MLQKALNTPTAETPPETIGIHSRLSVNLGAIAHNYRTLTQAVGSACPVIPVIKTNAYGLGLTAVAQTLETAGCQALFVGNISEAIELRKQCPSLIIYTLLGPQASTLEAFIEYNIRPSLNSYDQLQSWAKRTGGTLPAALHLDTGMGRQGLDPFEQEKLLQEIGLIEAAGIVLYMSHLASSDAPEAESNNEQYFAFMGITEQLPRRPRCLANSDGIFLQDGRFRLDAVRSGMSLLGGINSYTTPGLELRPTVTLESPILEIKTVPAGYNVSYNNLYTCTRKSRLATVAIGFADGIQRSLANNGHLYIQKYVVPIRGKICMDTCVIDITDIPESDARIGTAVELFGRQQSLQTFSKLSRTTPYWTLTSLASRIERRYS